MKDDESRLLEEAAEWRLISLLFECPSGNWSENVRSLAVEVRDEELRKAAGFAQTQASEGLYHSVFGPGGPAPAREISYRDWVQPGYLLSELGTFYDAFSYRPALLEPPDHIAVETGFVAYLRLKEAFARESENGEAAEITAKAARTFVDEHLAKMTERMTKTIAESDIDYLIHASAALFRRVGSDKDAKVRQTLPVLADPDEMIECVTG